MSIMLSIGTILLLIVFDLFKFGKYLPNYLVSISANIFKDQTILDYFYKNISITLLLILILTFLSIKLCKNRD